MGDEKEASAYAAKEGFSHGDELDCYVGDFDIAINHKRNADLRSRDKAQQFFEDVQNLKSLADLSTRDWLGRLPLDLCDEVIPLFDDDDSSTGYQLHPSFTNIALGSSDSDPHPDVFSLSVDGEKGRINKSYGPGVVMGIGRLFVNTSCADNGRLSKWTGYEVFVDHELGLWMVFDNQSKFHDHDGWYQFDCKLVSPQSQQPPEREPIFDYAKFCDPIRDVSSNSFNKALELAEKTKTLGAARMSQVSKKDINNLGIRAALVGAILGGVST
ncbi:hypothetical protein GGR58DRAFT_470037 [Xylaria digitata]|nr:hypothetical protein GGR58DRAFT_470037 [Xylaria digitata]